MNDFVKAIAIALISVIVCQVLAKQNKDMSSLLGIAVCALIAIGAMQYIHPMIDFFRRLKVIGQLEPELFAILIKAVGVGILSEITQMVCTDSGNSALGKSMQIMATSVIIWLSLPLLNTFIQMIENILEAL